MEANLFWSVGNIDSIGEKVMICEFGCTNVDSIKICLCVRTISGFPEKNRPHLYFVLSVYLAFLCRYTLTPSGVGQLLLLDLFKAYYGACYTVNSQKISMKL